FLERSTLVRLPVRWPEPIPIAQKHVAERCGLTHARKYLANAGLQRHREGRRCERARGALSKPLFAENMTSDHRVAGSSPAGCKAHKFNQLQSIPATKIRAF